MQKSSDDVRIETTEWDPCSPSVHQVGGGPSGAPVLLRHPAAPYVASVRDDGNDLRPLLFEVANAYIDRIPALRALGLSTATPQNDAAPGFGWLPLTWGEPRQQEGRDPRRSFWVQRHRIGSTHDPIERLDRTAVLLAARRIVVGGAFAAQGDGVGLRVVAHVSEPDGGRSRVRITGLSATGLEALLVPHVAAPLGVSAVLRRLADSDLRSDFLLGAQGVFNFGVPPAVHGVAATQGLAPELLLHGVGRRGPPDSGRVFAWTARVGSDGTGQLSLKSLIDQRSHAAAVGPDDVLVRHRALMEGVPLSASSHTRPDAEIDRFRHATSLLPAAKPDGLRHLLDERIEVMPSLVGNRTEVPVPTHMAVPEAALAMRSDDLAGAHAYVRAQELLQRFDAYGLLTDSYFRMARLPLRMQPRAMFSYASNGETVNAQVSPDDQGQNLTEVFDASLRPRLRVAFGCANLSHREMRPNRDGDLRAQPLGLAADRRWAWHEFGHVLNYASTGELEFRFAHSAGDALAAIVADPDIPDGVPERLRSLTFPWAMLRRSHARPAELGWCWCGQRSRLRLAHLEEAPPIPGGYFEEQLMSSSLFRLYEVIGGARGNAEERRRAASDYAVYLVMRAIGLLGSTRVVPAQSADDFVSALTDADAGTVWWDVQPTWPEDQPRAPLRRVGGTLHKVIRWAFEQQGLFATDDDHEAVDGIGRPPQVDVYIPGRRSRADGGYAPVPLGWSDDSDMPWHVDAGGIFPNGDHKVRVVVRNRGREAATGVTARAWWSPTGAALSWQALKASPTPGVVHLVGPAAKREFAFEARDGGAQLLTGRCFVLAEIGCPADRANLDPASGLPCAANLPPVDPSALTDLVANDNNLALRIVDFG